MDTVQDQGLERFATVRLTSDLGALTPRERAMIPLLVEAAEHMDAIYWLEMVGPRDAVLDPIEDPSMRRRVEINYCPWDRVDADRPFVPGAGERPKGARFYPTDMTIDEFEAAAGSAGGEELRSPYTLVRRVATRRLEAIPFHVAFEPQVRAAAALLRDAAALADDEGLSRYLTLRATALETDDYRSSDEAWMDMKSNTIDIVIGPIEVYDDKLFASKASHEAIVLIKDREWSDRIARYAEFLPGLQAALPVAEAYRAERPGLDGDLNVYDAIYHAGFANATPTASAINLPNDEDITIAKGTRRLQLKNVMRAKFDTIVRPIADLLLSEDQRPFLTFEAWFEKLMFHEVAHGLGIHRTIDGLGTVDVALRDQAPAVEEQKADAVGLFMLARLPESAAGGIAPLIGHQVAHVTDLFRSLRYGGESPYTLGAASQLNVLSSTGAVSRDADTGRWRIDPDRMRAAVEEMTARLLVLQGDGDYDGAARWYASTGTVDGVVRSDVERVARQGIPIDVVYEQGIDVLGLA